jgi:hypothetical protein
MKEKKLVHLSRASLGRVCDWCEKNEDDPLAIAYTSACLAVEYVDYKKIMERLERSWPGTRNPRCKTWGGWIGVAIMLEDLAIAYRDTIGRTILDVIKREHP